MWILLIISGAILAIYGYLESLKKLKKRIWKALYIIAIAAFLVGSFFDAKEHRDTESLSSKKEDTIRMYEDSIQHYIKLFSDYTFRTDSASFVFDEISYKDLSNDTSWIIFAFENSGRRDAIFKSAIIYEYYDDSIEFKKYYPNSFDKYSNEYIGFGGHIDLGKVFPSAELKNNRIYVYIRLTFIDSGSRKKINNHFFWQLQYFKGDIYLKTVESEKILKGVLSPIQKYDSTMQ